MPTASWKVRLAAGSIGLVAGLAVVAIGVLIMQMGQADSWNAPMLLETMECGQAGICRHRPDRTERLRDAAGGTFTVTSNRLGYRGPLPPEDAPSDALVVQLYGDSMIHGTGVQDAETLSANVQALLRAGLGRTDVYVTNFGMPMNYLVSSLTIYREWGRPLQPDWVVLMAPGGVPPSYDVNARIRQIEQDPLFAKLFESDWGKSMINAAQTRDAQEFDRDAAIAALQPGFQQLVADQRERGTRVAFFSFTTDFDALDAFVPEELRYLPIGTDLKSYDDYRASAYAIAGDGHPNAAGTRHFAGFIARAILAAEAPATPD